MLRGAEDISAAITEKYGIHSGETTDDGVFTLLEVECLGACCNAPMVQINDDFYEDLTPESIIAVLEGLKNGTPVKIGSQIGRVTSEPATGPTTLQSGPSPQSADAPNAPSQAGGD